MGKLDAALAWARRGFRVFPIQEGSKFPEYNFAHADYATRDENLIRALWTDGLGREEKHNIGVSTTGLIVADLDTKKGKQGVERAKELGLDWSTLVTRTPSGGYHLWYQGLDSPVGQHPLADGIDIRAHHGYVLAPGSVIDGVAYEIVRDAPLAPFPAHLRDRLRAPKERRTQPTDIQWDRPGSEEAAITWLTNSAPHAAIGGRGYNCYKVACRVRELGVSEANAVTLLAEHWNAGNDPPMPHEDLAEAVNHAYRYATGVPGEANAAEAFADVKPVEAPIRDPEPPPPRVAYGLGNLLALEQLQPRPWLFGRWLLRRAVTTLIAAPGGGKSLMTLIIACHGACGKPFAGYEWQEPVKSILYDAEDDLAELSRRVHAICMHYGLDVNLVRQNVSLNGPEELQLLITKDTPPTIHYDNVKTLIDRAREQGVSFIGLGPLADIHSANENDNPQMHYVMSVLAYVAQEVNCAVMVVHHTAKPPAISKESWSGSQFAGRGATSVPGKARIVLTMFPAADGDVIEGHIPAETRSSYVKLEVGKMSYARKPSEVWLRWDTEKLRCGDEVGVLHVVDSKELADMIRQGLASALVSEMVSLGTGVLDAQQAFGVMRRAGAVAKQSATEMRNMLTRMFGEGVPTDRGSVTARTENGKLIVTLR